MKCLLAFSTIALLVAACGTSRPATPAAPIVVTNTSIPITRTQAIRIEATDRLTFVPDTIMVTSGQPVQVTLINTGRLDHTFTISDLSIEAQLPASQTITFTFTAPAPGRYRFNSGVITEFDVMTGTLLVK